jgi:uncharacterized protein with HEPN domain
MVRVSQRGTADAMQDPMRDRLAHRYFDTSHAILASTIQHDLPRLEAAVERLTAAATSDDDS